MAPYLPCHQPLGKRLLLPKASYHARTLDQQKEKEKHPAGDLHRVLLADRRSLNRTREKPSISGWVNDATGNLGQLLSLLCVPFHFLHRGKTVAAVPLQPKG